MERQRVIKETQQPENIEQRLPVNKQPEMVRVQTQLSEDINPSNFLKLFPNNINPDSIQSVEKRSDGAIVMHCNNMYEYLNLVFLKIQKKLEK